MGQVKRGTIFCEHLILWWDHSNNSFSESSQHKANATHTK